MTDLREQLGGEARASRTAEASKAPVNRLLGEVTASGGIRRCVLPTLMTVLAVVAGIALLGLAGWFIAASAVAGLAAASTFSFLFPSAGVQALAWARTLARYWERTSTHRSTLDLVAALRTTLFARAVDLPRDRAAALRSSELVGRLTVDSDAVEQTLLRSAFPIISAAAAALTGVAALTAFSTSVGVVAAAGLTVTAGALVVAARRHARAPARALVSARAGARRAVIEAIDGLPELRSFGAERVATAEVARHLESYAVARRGLAKSTAGGQGMATILSDLTLLGVIAAAAGLLGGPPLSAPWFVCTCVITVAVFEPLGALSGAVSALARAREAAARLSELLPAHEGSPPSAVLASRSPGLELSLSRHALEARLRPGDTMLLTGASGAGKSTILRAIAGAPAPWITVRVGGLDPTTVKPEELVRQVTLVAQDAHVFDGTVRENLLLADPTAGDVQMWDALVDSALAETVAGLAAGLDTPVGPGGEALSGGQRRRLCVAQGLLRRPALLLLDEPTEGLDTLTAGQLLAGVRAALPESVLVIALHNRQAPELPWTASHLIELSPSVS